MSPLMRSSHAQLLANLLILQLFINGDLITTNFLFCEDPPKGATGEEMFCVTTECKLQNELHCKDCVSAYTDRAASMIGWMKGFIAEVYKMNPNVWCDHCLFQHETIVAKSLPPALKVGVDPSLFSFSPFLSENGIWTQYTPVAYWRMMAVMWESVNARFWT